MGEVKKTEPEWLCGAWNKETMDTNTGISFKHKKKKNSTMYNEIKELVLQRACGIPILKTVKTQMVSSQSNLL